MGILDDPQTCNGIDNEWELCTPELFESTDVIMHSIISNPQYKLPQSAPDGNYCLANVGIEKKNNPMSFSILYTYPNPFNPTTTIRFKIGLETSYTTSLQIIDVTGRLVETLVKGALLAGDYEIQWNATQSSSGVYFVELISGEKRQVQKLLLLK